MQIFKKTENQIVLTVAFIKVTSYTYYKYMI